jgi:hypothetical protein
MTYLPNIPQRGDYLTQSQSELLTEYTVLDSIYSVNHVPLTSVTDVGFHTKVDLPDLGGDPSAPPNGQGIVYVTGSGKDSSLMFRNGTAAYNLMGQRSTDTRGYAVLPGGIYIQWGSNNVDPAGVTLKFRVPFPTACGALIATGVGRGNSHTFVVGMVTTEQFFIQQNFGTSGRIGAYWWAIGY